MAGWYRDPDAAAQGWERQYLPDAAATVLEPRVRCLTTGELYPLAGSCSPQDCFTICGLTRPVRPVVESWPAPGYRGDGAR